MITMEAFQAVCEGEKLPLEGTLVFELLQTVYMHTNL